jgi:hypothetical protein
VTDQHIIARRQCLMGMLAAFALSSAGVFMGSQNVSPDKLASVHLALLKLLENPRDAQEIGLDYLYMLPPHERSADFLINEIFTGAAVAMWTPRQLRMIGRLVNKRMRRDFAEGAVVTVDRWILSVTEVRLYALAALA